MKYHLCNWPGNRGFLRNMHNSNAFTSIVIRITAGIHIVHFRGWLRIRNRRMMQEAHQRWVLYCAFDGHQGSKRQTAAEKSAQPWTVVARPSKVPDPRQVGKQIERSVLLPQVEHWNTIVVRYRDLTIAPYIPGHLVAGADACCRGQLHHGAVHPDTRGRARAHRVRATAMHRGPILDNGPAFELWPKSETQCSMRRVLW